MLHVNKSNGQQFKKPSWYINLSLRNSKSITNSLRSKIRDLSPSRRSTPPSSATKTERKNSKGNKTATKSPVSFCAH